MRERDKMILQRYAQDHPEAPTAFRPGLIDLKAIQQFSDWCVINRQCDEVEAGRILHEAFWQSPQR